MARQTVYKRLPTEIRELIGGLREQGRTIDEIREKLQELDVDIPRSTLGYHMKKIDAVGERIQEKRVLAETLVERLGDAPESRMARLNIELAHGMLQKNMMNEQGEEIAHDPREAMFLSTALQKLTAADKAIAERDIKVRQETAKELTAKLDAVAGEAEKAGERGLSAERVAQLRRDFLGVRDRPRQ